MTRRARAALWPAVLAVATLSAPLAAWAHVESGVPASFLGDWPFEAWVLVPLALVALCYAAGAARLRGRASAPSRGARWVFYGGLATVFVALQTPLDAISEHLFAMHQVQHLLMRGVAPMLLMFNSPAVPLIAGLPEPIRRRVLAPLLRNAGVRGTFEFLARPVVATLLYVGTLYAWQVPAWHDAALLDGALHDAMHVTMFASGMIFFWPVFDRQPAPWGLPFGSRIVMLGAAMFANIPLGAVTTLKSSLWYPAYDVLGRAWGVAPMADELLGGLVLWIASGLVGLLAVLLLLKRWGGAERRLEDRRERGLAPRPGGRDAADSRGRRRRFGWTLAAVPLAVFVCLLAFVFALRYGPLAHPARPAAPVPVAGK